jgi:hypothetical protein
VSYYEHCHPLVLLASTKFTFSLSTVPTASPSSPTSPPTTSRPTTSKPTAAPASVTYLWVPDWQVSNAGCVQSPSNVETYTPKYNDQSTCCSTHYNWDYVTCMGGSGTANTLTGWYPVSAIQWLSSRVTVVLECQLNSHYWD